MISVNRSRALTDAQRSYIYRNPGRSSQAGLAREFAVSRATIQHIQDNGPSAGAHAPKLATVAVPPPAMLRLIREERCACGAALRFDTVEGEPFEFCERCGHTAQIRRRFPYGRQARVA
jgi:hypothetical protein